MFTISGDEAGPLLDIVKIRIDVLVKKYLFGNATTAKYAVVSVLQDSCTTALQGRLLHI